MTTRKRNEFLDLAPSDDEDNDRGYDSEAAEESKARISKRRRTQNQTDESDQSDNDSDEDLKLSKSKGKAKKPQQSEDDDNDDDEQEETTGAQYLDVTEQETKPSKRKPLDKGKPPKKNKTGVVYLSSLPPYLKPFALKSMLEARSFGPITKVFLSPSVRPASAPRRRSNKRKTYTDGWVEFASKKTAKLCAETLNASIVGGRKGGWYHDDVWNMKYLKGFKWGDLMEQVQRERQEREAKQRIEDSRARKEDKVFLQGVETGKVLDGMQRKNEEKKKRKMEAGDVGGQQTNELKIRRTFKQNEVKRGRHTIQDGAAALEDDTKRVLGKIF
ncbi:Pre-rRNA-processing protein esf2 [Aspergillus pseudonomiae]|uniref:Pre-rRNA-processing protein ESF2 n=1 Tax=Aspergillus pseudonomiae TaxID=1506151 RepID=A0A5N7D3C9_9EURO|nr:Pre-rRNA-processing protein esf2 [Aspergillus pseudonomiae]KAE8400922.1 Pre-rRNA-processing protein esf2 [Aspergillus pseudonomiae]